jgi:hypothetical protein
MSTTYVKPASLPQVVSPFRGRGLLGLGAALAGVTAVGAAIAIFLAPAAPRALPAMDASLGYHDVIDTRPAVSRLESSQGYWDVVDARPAISRFETSMGYADVIDTRPAVSRFESSQGYWDVIDARPAVRELPAMPSSLGHWEFSTPKAVARPPMPRSMGHWDFTQKAEPTGLGFWDLID